MFADGIEEGVQDLLPEFLATKSGSKSVERGSETAGIKE